MHQLRNTPVPVLPTLCVIQLVPRSDLCSFAIVFVLSPSLFSSRCIPLPNFSTFSYISPPFSSFLPSPAIFRTPGPEFFFFFPCVSYLSDAVSLASMYAYPPSGPCRYSANIAMCAPAQMLRNITERDALCMQSEVLERDQKRPVLIFSLKQGDQRKTCSTRGTRLTPTRRRGLTTDKYSVSESKQ